MTVDPGHLVPIEMIPVGTVRGGRSEPVDDDWGDVLADFSHVEVVFVFDKVDDSTITLGARHPRGRADWPKVGIFAQRAKARPNRIGVTICEVVAVGERTLTVRGLDAIDGTPVLDLKPYMREFAPRTTVQQPAWSSELMQGHWHVPARADFDDRGFEIRRLGVGDIDDARAAFEMMHRVFASETSDLSDRYLCELLQDGSFWALGAFDAGEPLGCITAHELAMTRHERRELFIYDLAVDADHQRRGIGTSLVQRLVADAAAVDIDVVFVPADDEDTHALAFYESLGGRPTEATIFDLGRDQPPRA
ncbi:MAG: SAM-dependent methyltransferase [Microthrixaceae bacterium]|nr:SAM-dependent methyltransferase [Microthrixaceae bacterium]